MKMYSQSSFLINKTLVGFTAVLFINLFFFCVFSNKLWSNQPPLHFSTLKILPHFFRWKRDCPYLFLFCLENHFKIICFSLFYLFFSVFSKISILLSICFPEPDLGLLQHPRWGTLWWYLTAGSVNFYHKELHLGCCSSSVLASVSKDVSGHIFFHVKNSK